MCHDFEDFMCYITSPPQAIRIYISLGFWGGSTVRCAHPWNDLFTFFSLFCLACRRSTLLSEANWIEQSTKPGFTARRNNSRKLKHRGIVSMKTLCAQHFKHITVAGKDWQREQEKLEMLDRSVNRKQNPLSSSKLTHTSSEFGFHRMYYYYANNLKNAKEGIIICNIHSYWKKSIMPGLKSSKYCSALFLSSWHTSWL